MSSYLPSAVYGAARVRGGAEFGVKCYQHLPQSLRRPRLVERKWKRLREH